MAVVNLATGLVPLPRGQRPTSGMNFFKRAKEDYWIVDVRVRTTDLDFELDSADQGLSFHGTATVHWCVDSVERAAETGEFSVKSTLETWLLPALNSLARQYSMERVGELEERVHREWPGWFGGSDLLRIDGLACRLRPDPAVTDLIRGGTLDDIRRGQARKVLDGGRRGLMEDILAKDPQAAMTFYDDLREDEQERLRTDLEVFRVMANSEGAEDHQKAALVNALLERLSRSGQASLGSGTEAGDSDGGDDSGSRRDSGDRSERRRERRRDRRMRGEPGASFDEGSDEADGRAGARDHDKKGRR